MKKILNTEHAPKAIGPYSQGIDTGNLMFLSGQIPICPAEGEILAADIEGQTRQSLENVKAILASGGCTMDNVVKTTVYLKDIGDFAKMNEVGIFHGREVSGPFRCPSSSPSQGRAGGD